MEKPRLSQADIIRTQIIRGFQLVQVGEEREVPLGSAAEEIDNLFAAKGIEMIGRALSEADQLGVALPQKMRESATKLIKEKGSWAEQIMANEIARILYRCPPSRPPSRN